MSENAKFWLLLAAILCGALIVGLVLSYGLASAGHPSAVWFWGLFGVSP